MDDNSSEDLFSHHRLSSGCKLCFSGAKLVLFLTGLCERSCWYCPLSRERKGKDHIYANEHKVNSPEEMLEIAHKMSALGTGITGGEPLLFPDRLETYARALKNEFGSNHHIHLYTGTYPSVNIFKRFIGMIDELRFHPAVETWNDCGGDSYRQTIKSVKKLGFDVGLEVPSLPGTEFFLPLIPDLDFVNINELEWGDANADELRARGYELRGDISNAVSGGFEAVAPVLGNPKVHWCSSDFKDRVQLRMRLKRIAANTAREFDEITDDGTVVYGVWECQGQKAVLPDTVDPDLYLKFEDRVEMAWWVLDDLADDLTGSKYVIERYPDSGTIMEVTPL